jgi:hypothetical protein
LVYHILRGEHELRKFRNRVMKKIFGPKMEQVTGNRRKVHNKQFHDLILLIKYYSDEQISKNEVGGACGMYGG